jgi:uncharacterized protein
VFGSSRSTTIKPSVIAFALSAAALLLLLWGLQRRLIYFPFGDVPTPAAVGLQRAVPVTLATRDGLALGAWFVRAIDPSGFTFVIFNGNAGNRSFRAPLAIPLASAGHGVLLFDYRGYGENPGRPSEAGLMADAHAARSFLEGRADVDWRRLVYFGESLGSAVAVALAAEHPPAGLILRSPFTSLVDVGRFHYPMLPVRWLLRDRYTSIDRIGRIGCPMLVIAGSRDRIVPVDQSRTLFEHARQPKQLVLIDADHNDFDLVAGDRLIQAALGFVRTLN